MAKRLIKIAKELNVGTSTIVEHLHNHGFDIDNKPTAKITEDMYDELLKEFAGSMTIKEQADKMIIGTRPSGSPKEKEAAKTVTEEVSPESKEEETEEEVPEEETVEEEVEEPAEEEKEEEKEKEEEQEEEEAEEEKVAAKEEAEEKEEAESEEKEEEEKPALKVVGKIDLKAVDKKKKGKKKKKKEEKETEEEEEKVAAKEEAEEKKETKQKSKKEKDEEVEEETGEESEVKFKGELGEDVIKADAPQLKGLKIMGKIDSNKLDRRKKKEKKEKEKKPKPVASSDKSTKKKRRRKRRKVGRKRVSGGRRSKRDDTQEVSQKEIEEKIKATMARISGSGKKSKRQRVRRESRDEKREKQEMREQAEETGKLELTEFVTVQELANLMDVSATEVITTCMNLGVIVSINQRLDAEIIELVAEEYGHEVEFISAEEHLDDDEEIHDDPEDLEPRSPIVTVMGHVDHGKTSLLDYIREANVVGGEAGGITQHIGAYEVTLQDEKRITFLDTPGHEAFTAMRARGAKVTDVAVIIVAADDRVMPQTKEAISHAQAAGVPIIFAINKVDKEGAQPERIKQELAEMNLLVEEWGGKIQSQDISAKTGNGVDELLEKIILEAELLELKANPDRHAVGVVIEASLDKGRGYVTKILVQTGTLKIGDPIIAGEHSGKVKAMFNERGKRVKKAGPSNPVLVLGLSGAPQAGEIFKVTENEQEARAIATKRAQITREQANRASKRISLDEIGRRLALGNFKELNLIVKGDVDGSVEALSDSLIKLSIETVQVNVIHKAVGQIKESDVLLASASDAIVIGFQVRPSLQARNLAEREGVEIKLYSIIYEAIEEVKSAIEGMLEPTREEKIVGQVEVQQIYKISRIGTVAGCLVQDGSISRNSNIRVIRDGIVVYPTKEGVVGELASLKRYKDDVKEVKNGMECGITVKNYNDIKVGDVIEAYEIIEKKQRLE